MQTMIVGAGSGIGRALAFEMAGRGHDLILAGRTQGHLEDIASQVSSRHNSIEVAIRRLDLVETEQCQALCSELRSTTERINNFIYCAGVGKPAGGFRDFNPADLQEALTINTVAPTTLMHGLLPVLSGDHPLSRIVLIGAGMDRRIQPGTLSYGVSKMALRRIFEQLSVELVPDEGDPAVSLFQPGLVDTPGIRDHLSKARFFNLPHAGWLDQRLKSGDSMSAEQAASAIAHTLHEVPITDFHGTVFHGADLVDTLSFSAS
jgi:3-oxoacyl-[acyl-carrier protein] reductase